ncbi:MAG: hypothetical protein ACREJ4_11840 [Candidatus Methylomirabilaceae bacterium]
MIVDITQTAIAVYRVCSDDGEVQGYALTPQEDAASEPITCIDETLDSVGALQVHVFGCKTAARAFQEGLILGGDEPSDSIVGRTSLGWAVLRECSYPPDPGDPTVAVITYQWRDAEEEARPD